MNCIIVLMSLLPGFLLLGCTSADYSYNDELVLNLDLIKKCETYQNSIHKQNCYLSTALENNNYLYCLEEKNNGGISEKYCLSKLAEEYGDLTLCELTIDSDQDSCVTQALNSGKLEYTDCHSLNSSLRVLCEAQIGIVTEFRLLLNQKETRTCLVKSDCIDFSPDCSSAFDCSQCNNDYAINVKYRTNLSLIKDKICGKHIVNPNFDADCLYESCNKTTDCQNGNCVFTNKR